MRIRYSSIPILLPRVLQTFSSTIVFVLSTKLIYGHKQGVLPTPLIISALAGAVSLFSAILGVTASYQEKPSVGIIDGVAMLLSLVGGFVSTSLILQYMHKAMNKKCGSIIYAND
jgi:hypothetical protein